VDKDKITPAKGTMDDTRLVTIIHDSYNYDTSFVDLVKRYHSVRFVDVNSIAIDDINHSLLVIIQVNLSAPESLRPLKEKMLLPGRAPVPVLFLLNEFTRHSVVQANMLGATDYIAYPCPDSYFINIVADMVNNTVEKAWSRLSHTQEMALKVSLKVLEDSFNNARTGEKINQADLKDSCDLIIEATAKDGLTDWMQAIREHHNYTYRHSMMVCGYLVSFGIYLGISNVDLQQLSLGGIIHDIGKSLIPLEILDKPAKLTAAEWQVMQQHPVHSRTIMTENDWDNDLIDIAVHHHEKLDGTGYPDGLAGKEVSDLARMAAIADVFSGLTDKRSYKPAMSAEKAVAIMLDMSGHLDLPLVGAFRNVVLSEQSKK